MYYDEDLVLDLRLNILDEFVKKFVVVEANYTHSGKKRNFNFSIDKFQKFKDKIIYIQVEKLPSTIRQFNPTDNDHKKNSVILDNALERENFQRNQILQGLTNCADNDLVIVGDVDEIPNIKNFKHKNKISIFFQKMFYYKFNLMHPTITWVGSKACKKKDLLSPQWLRNVNSKKYPIWRIDTFFSKKKYLNLNFIENGGWHFTNIKSHKEIHFKLSNYLHHLEYEKSNISLNDLKKIVEDKKIIYDHNVDKKNNKWGASMSLVKVNNSELPEYLVLNKEKYTNFFD